MITDKDIENSRKVLLRLIQEGIVVSVDSKYVNFFLKKAEQSLETAHAILKISYNQELRSIEVLLSLKLNNNDVNKFLNS